MGTFRPTFFYHPAPEVARRWCATPDDRVNLLLKDARWRDTPCTIADLLLFFAEHGIDSIEARTAWCVAMLNAESYLCDHARGPFTYAHWWEGIACIRPTPAVLVAQREFIHHAWWLSVGEIFQVTFNDDIHRYQLTDSAVRASEILLEGDTITARHPPTGRFFLSVDAYIWHAESYEHAVHAGLVPAAHPLLSIVASSEALPLALVRDYAASQHELGRIAQAVLGADTAWNRDYVRRLWLEGTLAPPPYPAQNATLAPALNDSPQLNPSDRLPTDSQLLRALKRAAREIRGAGGRVTQATLGRKLPQRRGRNTVGKMLKQLGIKASDL